jgi:hypothetical protein
LIAHLSARDRKAQHVRTTPEKLRTRFALARNGQHVRTTSEKPRTRLALARNSQYVGTFAEVSRRLARRLRMRTCLRERAPQRDRSDDRARKPTLGAPLFVHASLA